MIGRGRRRPAVAGPGVEDREHIGQGAHHNSISAAEIAHALEARRTGSGRWIAHCPAHEDRSPSLSIREGYTAPLLTCFGGCDRADVIEALRKRGLWARPTDRALRVRRRRGKADQLWREALRHLTHSEPLRWPPYTRSLPRTGEVWIMCGPNAWTAAQALREHGRHALVWPYAERGYIPCIAYRWPVAGRVVRVFDTANDLAPNVAWSDMVRDFGRLLVSRWRAARVEVYGDFGPVRYEPEGTRHAA